MIEKDYVKSHRSDYFSGQGIVSLETGDKIYDIGNCSDLVFYKNGEFRVVWESLSPQNIELLLGTYIGSEEFTPGGGTSPIKFNHYKINRDFSKRFTLHFTGVNTAQSNDPIVVKAVIKIKMAEFISLLNDDILALLTVGEWFGDISLFLAADKPKDTERYSKCEDKSLRRKCVLAQAGNLVKVLRLDTETYDYVVERIFNPSYIVGIEPQLSTAAAHSTLEFENGSAIELPISVQSVANFLESFSRDKKESRTHTEKRTGKRLVDYKYEPTNSNKITHGVN